MAKLSKEEFWDTLKYPTWRTCENCKHVNSDILGKVPSGTCIKKPICLGSGINHRWSGAMDINGNDYPTENLKINMLGLDRGQRDKWDEYWEWNGK